MSIEKRLERLEAILDARGLDWDHPRVEEKPAKEPSLGGLPDLRTFAQPNLRWRILEVGEVVQEGDRVTAKKNPPSDPPNGLGWIPVIASVGATVCEDDSGIFARLVADEPAKEAEHPAGPMPDPGEGYRILSKDPPEDLAEGDDFWFSSYSEWHKSFHATLGITSQCDGLWFRRKIEPPKPAWEPKVGEWVKVTRPENWKEWKDPLWREEMHIYDGKVFELVKWSQFSTGRRASLQGIDWFFHRDWLSPADEPVKEPEHPAGPMPDPGEGYRILSKNPPEDLQDGDELFHPGLGKWILSMYSRLGYQMQDTDCWYRRKIETPKDEYREPVLPADAGKRCEFSISGKTWDTLELVGWNDDPEGWPWKSRLSNNSITCWKQCRIKKDA